MNRRESLLALSTLASHALFPEVLERFGRASVALADAPDAWHPEILSPEQGRVLAEVVETILPETDTPGAKAARVHVFVDLAVRHCLSPADQRVFLEGLDGIAPGFLEATPRVRQERLARMAPAAFALLKELTVLGYFTSEIGATRALAYEAVPGEYRGCIDLKPGQKTWAT